MEATWEADDDTHHYDSGESFQHSALRFSLAGVAMKFSMIRTQDRLTLPAHGQGGDWIVKTPDSRFRDVPRNEFAMMSLARAVGIEVPEIMLVSRQQVDERLPSSVWPEGESYAYAIRRFDRDENRERIHIEDLAQVRNVYPERKYISNFETVASLIYRRHDEAALFEFVRRLTFCILITNGDAHLKNWSLIYRDPRIPTLSPAYDLVATGCYPLGDQPEDLGMKFGGTKAFHRISLSMFARLQERLGAHHLDLVGCAVATVEKTVDQWPRYAKLLDQSPGLQNAIDLSVKARAKTLLGHLGSGHRATP